MCRTRGSPAAGTARHAGAATVRKSTRSPTIPATSRQTPTAIAVRLGVSAILNSTPRFSVAREHA